MRARSFRGRGAEDQEAIGCFEYVASLVTWRESFQWNRKYHQLVLELMGRREHGKSQEHNEF